MRNRHAIIVVTGIQAAGKSTVARLLAQRFARGVHIEADALQRMIVSGAVWAQYLDTELRSTMAGVGLWIDPSHLMPEETVDEILWHLRL